MMQIGLILIFGIVLAPVYVFILASFLGKPRNFRIPLIAVGWFLLFIVLAILVFLATGIVLSFLVP